MWKSENHGGSTDEPQNRRKRQGERRQYDERVSYEWIMMVTRTPESHDGYLD
jgi:hypothetical protein